MTANENLELLLAFARENNVSEDEVRGFYGTSIAMKKKNAYELTSLYIYKRSLNII